MPTVKEITAALFELAPRDAKMDFDNVGLLAGNENRAVTKLLTALDITADVIDEAQALGCELIVAHHPVLFSERTITDATFNGRRLLRLISSGIAAICMHTNLDAAQGGVNDALAQVCGLEKVELLVEEGRYADGTPYSYGRLGALKNPLPLSEYLPFLKNSLQASGLRFLDAGRDVSRVAVVGGSGGDYLKHAIARECDTLITADIKYDVFLEARDCDINLIDADHFCTENTVIPQLCAFLNERFPDVDCNISGRHRQSAEFFV